MIAVAFVLTGGLLLGACGGDDGDGGGDVSFADLASHLPAADDLGLTLQGGETDWDNATDVLVQGLVIPDATSPSELGTAIEDAGFQAAVGSEFGDPGHNVRIVVAQFDSEEGALKAQEALHEEDLKQPCREACVVAPREYELDEIPNSVAVHHVPVQRNVPPGQDGVEAHHAEFVLGPQLYVVQVDGPPSSTFTAEFDKLMRTVYETASRG